MIGRLIGIAILAWLLRLLLGGGESRGGTNTCPQPPGGDNQCNEKVALIGGSMLRVGYADAQLRLEGYDPVISTAWQKETNATGTTVAISIAFVKAQMKLNRHFIDIGYPRGKPVEKFEKLSRRSPDA